MPLLGDALNRISWITDERIPPSWQPYEGQHDLVPLETGLLLVKGAEPKTSKGTIFGGKRSL